MKLNSIARVAPVSLCALLVSLCALLAPPLANIARAQNSTNDTRRFAAPRPASQSQPAASQAATPQVEQWFDEFNGATLDESKWERFTFEGGGGGKLEVSGGQLRLRSVNKTRAGVRSKQSFNAERFSVEAVVAKVGAQLPEAGDRSSPIGYAALTLLFDGAGRNRVEWIFTSEHTLEAWSVVDGVSERLDNRKLGLKFDNPVLAVVRRGDDFLFIINKADGTPQDAQVALQKTIKNLPRSFHVMLYGFGSSQNDWDSVRVVTPK